MIRLKVEGMSCQHCVRAVTEALSEVDGVEEVVEVSLERNEAIIEGRPEVAQLIAAIAEVGYTAELAT